jgi:hypothetical protein
MTPRLRLLLGACAFAACAAFVARAFPAGPAIEVLVDHDVVNTFGSSGAFRQGRASRVFVLQKGRAAGAINGFDPANNDKLRISGFGLTKPEAAKALMREDGADTILDLPGEPPVKLVHRAEASIPDTASQLELDQNGLTETFAEDFRAFSQYAESTCQGRWLTHYGWQEPNQEGSLSLPGELEVYAVASFTGAAQEALALDPFRIADGGLEIRAEPAPVRVLPFIWGRRYVSGLITTKYSFSQLYGVFEIRAKLPRVRGLWPAFWLLPADGSWPPETGVFEALGHECGKLYLAAHTKADGPHRASGGDAVAPDLCGGYHQYAAEWNEREIRWYLDGVEIKRAATPGAMRKPMYLLADLAVGGGWADEPDSAAFPAVYAIEWIRAYQRRAQETKP